MRNLRIGLPAVLILAVLAGGARAWAADDEPGWRVTVTHRLPSEQGGP
jgi:hypothetical protein